MASQNPNFWLNYLFTIRLVHKDDGNGFGPVAGDDGGDAAAVDVAAMWIWSNTYKYI
jgi:hypothetical protein